MQNLDKTLGISSLDQKLGKRAPFCPTASRWLAAVCTYVERREDIIVENDRSAELDF